MQIVCPNCGEEFDLPADAGEGSTEFVTDCEICCRPLAVLIRIHNGCVETLNVSPA